MARARIAAAAAAVLILVLSATAIASPGPMSLTDGSAQAAVAWPTSTTLLIAEVVTGGASASDEYVELTNASSAAVDLAGLEVAYVTSSGSTVTRKATWASTTLLEPDRHLLIANSTGAFGASADAVYSGGFAATGGAVIIRPIGGLPIDAVGWGDAANAFVEGAAAPAPPAGSSIERRPGGSGGNVTDTNDNAADFAVNGSPAAQGLAAGPVPAPGASPNASPTPTATPAATPAATPTATVAPTPAPVATPTPTAAPSSTPTASPTAPPTLAAPTPTATPGTTPAATPGTTPAATPGTTPAATPGTTPAATPVPTPVATPTPASPTSIEAVRAMADGTEATVEGILTTNLGALESARGGFVQDATGGIAIYLDAAFGDPIPAGMRVRLAGTLDSRFEQRTLRVDREDVIVVGTDQLPAAFAASTGEASEPLEGVRLELTGTVTETPGQLSDGLGITIDDGSGPVRVVAGSAALGGAAPAKGSIVVARGPLGQRDSSGTGLEDYRLNATLSGELEVSAAPTPPPSPTATPAPTAAPTKTPAPTPSASPTLQPTPSPTNSPSPMPTVGPTATPTTSPSPAPSGPALTVADARHAAIGSTIVVRGVVVAEAGRLGTPAILVIADTTGGLPVRLPDGVAAPARGTVLEVRGVLADPYGQLEVRAAKDSVAQVSTGNLPSPMVLDAGAIGEATEGRLVRVAGTIATSASRSSSGDLAFSITGTDGATLRILADASAGLDPATLRKGVVATFTGVAGQRATHKGALDGYRVWLRARADVTVTAQPSPKPTTPPKPTASPKGSHTPKPSGGPSKSAAISVRAALLRDGQQVTVEGVLTIGTGLLDAGGRRTIVEDGTAAIEVYLAAPEAAMRLGARVRVTGTVGQAWGAPRLRAEATRVLGTRQPTVHAVRTAPTAAVEWRLVKVEGTVLDVHRNGDRWSAELQLGGGAKVPISGLAGSGIASTAMVEGRRATVTGIVKRPYPTATDRRFAVVPRRAADIVLGKAAAGPSASATPVTGGGTGSSTATMAPIPGSSGSPAGVPSASAVDVDLRDLVAHVGQRVRVGGLVTEVTTDGVRLDDGTSGALIVLDGDAADLRSVLEPGDALNATGTPDQRDEVVLVVAGATDVELVGDLGGTDPNDAAATEVIGLAALTVDGSGAPASASASAEAGVTRPGVDPVTAGLAGLALVVSTAAAVALAARRRRARGLSRTRIAARLEALGRGSDPASGGPDRALAPPIGTQSGAELGGNVRGSA